MENLYRPACRQAGSPIKSGMTMVVSAVLLGLVFFLPKSVLANEGTVNLRSGGTNGACFAASVFVDGTYRILITCRELKTALSPEKNRYVAWVEDDGGKQKSLGEIVNGKLATLTSEKFIKMFITAETDGYGNKPSEDVLLTGLIQPIDFGAGIISTPIITPTPTPTQVLDNKTTQNNTTAPSQAGLGSALSTVFKIALLGFGVLLLIVGVFSFLSRRRGL